MAWVFAVSFSNAQAGFGFKLDGSLNKSEISHAFFEGEFSRILPPLEMYRQSFPASATRDDSIFVYKYLSVIYAADSSTRHKAESFMFQLIKMNPAIELIDLYVSDTIESIFRNVKKDYLEREKYMRDRDVLGNGRKDTASAATLKPHSKAWIGWTLGGIGVAAAATTAYYILHEDENPSPNQRVKP
jgi:hypothetical protein